MSKDLNRWEGIGRLGRDPEIKYSPSGAAICNLSIACSDSYKDKNSGEVVDKTEWVRIVAFNRLAEVIGQYLSKGSQIYVAGKLTTRKWQDQGGQDRFTTEVVASEMQMLGSKNGSGTQNGSKKNQTDSQQRPAQQFDDFDDDIPFDNPYRNMWMIV